MGPITIRRGTDEDVLSCTAVWRSTVDPQLGPPDRGYDLYAHEIRTGTLLVATQGGTVVGFAGSITRGDRWFLADLFVSPSIHGGGLGRRLLDALIDVDRPTHTRATMSSTDHRALTLYAQQGMTPRWPCFSLASAADRLGVAPTVGTTTRRCEPDDLRAHAGRAGYRLDPDDLAYWLAATETDCELVVDHTGSVIGGAVVKWSTPFAVADPTAVTIGPVFAQRGPDSTIGPVIDTVVASVRPRAGSRALRLYVPGPSPALAPLLARGFRIDDFDLFCSSDEHVLDPHRVCPSHDLL